jgi:hypothetical protein
LAWFVMVLWYLGAAVTLCLMAPIMVPVIIVVAWAYWAYYFIRWAVELWRVSAVRNHMARQC